MSLDAKTVEAKTDQQLIEEMLSGDAGSPSQVHALALLQLRIAQRAGNATWWIAMATVGLVMAGFLQVLALWLART